MLLCVLNSGSSPPGRAAVVFSTKRIHELELYLFSESSNEGFFRLFRFYPDCPLGQSLENGAILRALKWEIKSHKLLLISGLTKFRKVLFFWVFFV